MALSLGRNPRMEKLELGSTPAEWRMGNFVALPDLVIEIALPDSLIQYSLSSLVSPR